MHLEIQAGQGLLWAELRPAQVIAGEAGATQGHIVDEATVAGIESSVADVLSVSRDGERPGFGREFIHNLQSSGLGEVIVLDDGWGSKCHAGRFSRGREQSHPERA